MNTDFEIITTNGYQFMDIATRESITNNVMQEGVRIPMAQSVPSDGLFQSILSWFNSSPIHWLLLAIAVIFIAQIYTNQIKHRARIGTVMGIGFILLSVAVWVKINVWLGGILGFLSLWLTLQANTFREEEVEEIEEDQPLQHQVPVQMPIKAIPQPRADMFGDFQMPRIGLGLGLDL